MSKPIYDIFVAQQPRGRTRNDGKRWLWWMPQGGHGHAKTKNELIELVNRHFKGNVVLKLAVEADTALAEIPIRQNVAPIAAEEQYKGYARAPTPVTLEMAQKRCELAISFAKSQPDGPRRNEDLAYWQHELDGIENILKFKSYKRPARKVPDATQET